METSTLVIGILITLLCILPFVYALVKNKNSKNDISEYLRILALSKNSSIGEIENCRDIGLSLSEDNKYLFFYHIRNNIHNSEIIEIGKYAKCELIKVKTGFESTITIFKKIELHFQPKSKNEKVVILDIYNAKEYGQLNGELQLAEKWSEKVNSLL